VSAFGEKLKREREKKKITLDEVERDILHAWHTTPPATKPQQQLRFSP